MNEQEIEQEQGSQRMAAAKLLRGDAARLLFKAPAVSPRGLARAIFLDEPCDITSLVVALIEGQGHPGSSLDHTKIMKALVNWHHDEIKVQKIESAAYQDYLNSAEHALTKPG